LDYTSITRRTMTYIIVQIENPLDLDSMSVLPDENELKIKQFRNQEDAVRFLDKHDMLEELEYDAKIVRLH
jgi:phosphopantetheinyl transferase